MSHHPDESGAVLPDDRLLVRPYVAPSGRPSPSTAPAWPRSGPAATRRAPAPAAAPGPARGSGSGSGSAPVAAAGPDGTARRGRRLPVAVSVLLGLGAVGGLALLLTGPEERRPERAVAPPGLSVPVLPARSPGAGAEPSPGPSTPPPGSRSPSVPASASASARPGAASGVSTSPNAPASGSAPAGTPSARTAPAEGGTLRPGDRGSEVRALQERLHGQGFTYVVVNGVYDGRTRRGVAQLQSDRGISGDPQGVYGPATRAAFG